MSALIRDATVLSTPPWHRRAAGGGQKGREMLLWALPEDPHGRQAPALKPNLPCWGAACGQSPLNPTVPEEDLLRLTLWLTFCSWRSFFFKGLEEIISQTDLLNAEEKPTHVCSPGGSA